ncbi:MAG TPA: ABC transporter substrate-binding protein [Solirubrobacteraceae bacterium]|jgi:branched-chain amino acid transport system substrate-binding protein|nr:ABC transporter substrate-binding protein [Solirubrobacteraceae bacterium]
MAILGAAALTACGSSASGSGAGGGGGGGQSASKGATLTIADVAPFTGTDAALGPTYLVACDATTKAINADGGVLGHKFKCKSVDTRGDPADAVPAVRQMYASTSNLSLVIGCTSDEAASVTPVFGSNKTVSFCMTGQAEFDHVKFPYFYRLVPPDLSESYAMVAIAKHQGYKRIALAFGNDIGSQTFVKPAIAAIKKAGMSLVANETLDLSATTFRTEAARIANAKPDVIMTEALGPTEASFLSEVKQLGGGKQIPVIGTSATISPDWFKSVSASIGGAALASNFSADNLVVETSGPAYATFSKAINAEKGKVGSTGSFSTYLTAPGAVHLYDGINLAALAMLASHSTSSDSFKPWIEKIGDGVPGATVVHSFSEGAAALKQGKKIRYIGPGGPTSFDAYHDSTGIFQVDKYTADGTVKVASNLSTAELRSLGL